MILQKKKYEKLVDVIIFNYVLKNFNVIIKLSFWGICW